MRRFTGMLRADYGWTGRSFAGTHAAPELGYGMVPSFSGVLIAAALSSAVHAAVHWHVACRLWVDGPLIRRDARRTRARVRHGSFLLGRPDRCGAVVGCACGGSLACCVPTMGGRAAHSPGRTPHPSSGTAWFLPSRAS